MPIRFGIFEVDLQAGELRRQGLKVKLQEQPFQVLGILLERPGEVVTREELQKRLWPADTFVDFERGLNRAINKLREALADNADSPRFIETLPRRGYRFLAPAEKAGLREPEGAGTNQLPVVAPDRPPKAQASRRQVLPWAAAGGLALIAAWGPWRSEPKTDRPFLQMDLDAGHDGFSQPAISPDGMRIVFVSKDALAVRRLDQAKPTPIAGTDGAAYPFFSPNGQWVAFFAAGRLQKVALEGGASVQLCDAPNAAGGTWGAGDIIVAAFAGGLYQVPAAGGMPRRLTDSAADPAGALLHRWPQVLPGGKGVLFAATNGSWQGSLRVLTPKDGKFKTLVENSTHGRYLASGYLVYYQRGTLFAAPMDPDRTELTGPPVPLVYGVSNSGDRAEFDVSSSGTLIYRGGTGGTNATLSWLFASGKTEPVLAKPGVYLTPRLSPDGTRVAMAMVQEGKQNLWVYDLRRENWTRLTSGTDPDSFPTWTPDGEFLAFRSGNSLAWTRSDGSGKVEHLEGADPNAGPWSFSADGKTLAFWPLQPGSDLWTVPVERPSGGLRLGRPQPLLEHTGSQGAPAISPDNRWLAYTSDESGRFEVYVMPFSPHGTVQSRKWLVSIGGGWAPIWSPGGGQLFYQTFDHRVCVAAFKVKGNAFAAEKAHDWSTVRVGDTGFLPGFDVAPDGKRVLALLAAEDPRTATLVRALLNVDTELARRMANNPGSSGAATARTPGDKTGR